MSAASQSTARLVGLLIVGVLFLAGVGLFSVHFTHSEGEKALDDAVANARLLDDARRAQATFKIQVQDWKNLLLRGHDAKDYEDYIARFQGAEADVQRNLDDLLKSGMLPEALHAEVAAIRIEHQRLGAEYREAIARFQQGRMESSFEVDRSVRGIDQELTRRVDAVAQRILELESRRVAEIKQADAGRYARVRLVVGAATVIVLGLIVGVAWRSRR